MYIGDPHNVAAIISPGRNLANPKSAEERIYKLNLQQISTSLQNDFKIGFSEFLTLNINCRFFD